MTNQQVLRKWAQSNLFMLHFSGMIFIGFVLSSFMDDPKYRITQSEAVQVLIASVCLGKGLDLFVKLQDGGNP
jgi:hypothetical protein